MSIRDKLRAQESIMSDHDPFYATSERIVYYKNLDGREEFSYIDYSRLESVEIIKEPNHKALVAGTLLIVGGAIMAATLQYLTAWPAIIFGVGAMIYGGIGRESHYQILASNMTNEESSMWRLPYWGSGSFIRTIKTVVGLDQEFI